MPILFNRFKLLILRRPNLWAALFFVVLVLLFLSPGILSGGYYAPVDILNYFPYLSHGHSVHNEILTDVIYQFLPWYKLSGQQLSAGYLPLWNNYSGTGLPFMANMQSAILFPLTWLYFILSFKAALLLGSGIKLFAIGLLTFLFLRSAKYSYIVAIIGATAFMFSGTNIVWLLWPLSSAVIALPAGLYFLSRYLNSGSRRYLFCFSLTIALGLVSGHPETYLFIYLMQAGFFLWNLTFVNTGCKYPAVKNVIRFIMFSILGFGLSAVVWMPFLEYVNLSVVFRDRLGSGDSGLPPQLFIANFIPDYFGNQILRNYYFLKNYSYNELGMGYVGMVMWMALVVGFRKIVKVKFNLFFIACAIFSFLAIYQIYPLHDLIRHLPGFNISLSNRIFPVFTFSIVVLGCSGLDMARKSLLRWWDYLMGVGAIFFTMLILVATNVSANEWLTAQIRLLSPEKWEGLVIRIFMLACLLSVIVIVNFRHKAGQVAVLILIIIEVGIHGMWYNSVSQANDFYPDSGALSFLHQAYVQEHLRMFPYSAIMPPNLGTWYGFNQITSYDAIGLSSESHVISKIADFTFPVELTNDLPSLNALSYLSVKYLMFSREDGELFYEDNKDSLSISYEDKQVLIFKQFALPRAYLVKSTDNQSLSSELQGIMANPKQANIYPVENYQLRIDGQVDFDYQTEQNTYVVMNDSYYPDWRAVIDDGSSVSVVEAEGLRAAYLPAGRHHVKVFYRPISFYAGLLISMLSLLLMVGYIVRQKLFRKSLP